jgi:hypothetical protein
MSGLDINKEICRHNNNCEALLAVLKEADLSCKDVVKAINNHGNLPMHHVMAYCYGEGVLDLVKYLLELHPECAKTTCHAGYLPIHVMPKKEVYQQSQLEARLFLTKQYPGGMVLSNKLGNTPICQAIASNCNEVVRSMIEAYPLMTKRGWSRVNLFDFAIKKKNKVATQLILSSSPETLTDIDGLAKLLPECFEISCNCENEKAACGCKRNDHAVMQYLKASRFPMYRQQHVWVLLRCCTNEQQVTSDEIELLKAKLNDSELARTMQKDHKGTLVSKVKCLQEKLSEFENNDIALVVRKLQEVRKSEVKLLENMDKEIPIADLKEILKSLAQRLEVHSSPGTVCCSVARVAASYLSREDQPSRRSLVGTIVALNKELSEIEG